MRKRTAVYSIVVPLAFLLTATLLATPVAAQVSDVGYEGLSTAGTGTPTGTKRAESVLWWNDGFWWGNMWDSISADFHIFRLDTAGQNWMDTGVVTDRRANSHSDVLWDGSQSKLYVASHLFVNDELAAVSGYPSYLYRFSYNTSTKAYTLDVGFPEQINNMRTETLVIDKDSTGKLWATWQQDNQIYVNRTTSGDRTWGSPFPLPVTGAAVTVDDISALEAFGGNKIGVMWSNQGPTDAMYFAVHVDGAADDVWEASRTAFQGSDAADDHISLKTLTSDSGGRVYAAIKTSFTSSAQPLIMMLVRDPVTGDWESFTIARVSDCPNRPSLLVDEQNGVVHAFYTAPGPPGYTCSSSGGAIYEKVTPLDAISFPTGAGTALIMDADSPYMNNASSTKQNINAKTGMVVLAVNSSTNRYWHSHQTIPGGTTASPVASFTAVQATSPALTMAFTDTSTNSPTSWSWNFGDSTTSTAQHPTHTYASAGTYSVTLTASNSSGSGTASNSVAVVAAPVASFTSSTTGGVAPLAVTFTDTSTNSPTSWSWNFGDGTTSTAQHPSHTYASAGTYSVTLTASNAGGSSTSAATTIVVTDFGLTATPSSQSVVRGGSVKYQVTVTPQNGFDGAVTLSVSGLGSGATATFDPNPTVSSAELIISTTATAKTGSFTLTIDGETGAVARSTTVTLQVKRK